MTREELRKIRQQHRLTQKAMAHLLGYSENYIRRLENGHERITQRLEKLVVAMLPKKRMKKSFHTP